MLVSVPGGKYGDEGDFKCGKTTEISGSVQFIKVSGSLDGEFGMGFTSSRSGADVFIGFECEYITRRFGG